MIRLFALLLLCAPALADDPPKPAPPAAPVASAVVTPAGPVPPGAFIQIDATASVADSVLWDTDLDPASYRVDSNGLVVTLAAPLAPGTYTFRLDAFKIRDGKIAAGRAKPSFTVTGTIRPIPPDVTPPGPVAPPVAPVVAPADFGMAAATRAILATIPNRAAIQPTLDNLSATFLAVARAGPTYPTAQAMSSDGAAKVKALIGAATWSQWQVVIAPIVKQEAALIAAGKVATTADLAELYTEIAAGLKGN